MDRIRAALATVNPRLIDSHYASSLVEHSDNNFVQYLAAYLTPAEKAELEADPNGDRSIRLLEDLGYAWYNYYYLGNPGYEYTLFGQ